MEVIKTVAAFVGMICVIEIGIMLSLILAWVIKEVIRSKYGEK